MNTRPSQSMSYAAIAAKAREMYDNEYRQNNPPALRPQWESQPLNVRTEWLNKATRQIDREAAQRGRKAPDLVGADLDVVIETGQFAIEDGEFGKAADAIIRYYQRRLKGEVNPERNGAFPGDRKAAEVASQLVTALKSM